MTREKQGGSAGLPPFLKTCKHDKINAAEKKKFVFDESRCY